MKLQDATAAYYDFSGGASKNARTLAVSGFAVIWLLSGMKLDGLSPDLLRPSVALVSTLALDFLQYAISSALWGHVVNTYEKRGSLPADDIGVYRFINVPGRVCFWLKLLSTVVAYAFLLTALITRLR